MSPESALAFLGTPLFVVAETSVSLGALLLGALFAFLFFSWLRARRLAAEKLTDLKAREEATERRLEAILRSQAEIAGRMQTMAEIFGSRQADLTRAVSERLDGLSSRVGQSMFETTKETKASLSALAERLAVIDRAQGHIRDLAGEVVRLQDILSNKQARGAFGQGRMEAIIADGLPQGAYAFQATLSNGRRPDCLISMPNGAPSLAIDAKFPLEAWSALREAGNEEARHFAGQRFRRDMDVHVRAVAEKYLIPGETQDTAFLFVPSESIFAEIHEGFCDIVQKAHRARVIIVSPSLLMLSIQVIQALLKDARMKEQAGLIQREVGLLGADLQRLDARVRALQTHFGQSARDLEQILISTDKLMKRGEKIEAVELGGPERGAARPDLLAGE